MNLGISHGLTKVMLKTIFPRVATQNVSNQSACYCFISTAGFVAPALSGVLLIIELDANRSGGEIHPY